MQGNKLPPSYYLMKAILEVQDISSVEWHACEAGCTGWEPTPKAQWHKHKHDHCQKCKGKRFKTVMGKLVPVRVRACILVMSSLRVPSCCPCCHWHQVHLLSMSALQTLAGGARCALLLHCDVMISMLQHVAQSFDAHTPYSCAVCRCSCSCCCCGCGRRTPLQRFWFVLPEDSIKELMSDPEFVAALLAAKVARVGSFWASAEFNRLNKAVGGVLTSTLHGVIELGFDFAQPYNFVQHSTGLMFMR